MGPWVNISAGMTQDLTSNLSIYYTYKNKKTYSHKQDDGNAKTFTIVMFLVLTTLKLKVRSLMASITNLL